jgi:hypothetical protein
MKSQDVLREVLADSNIKQVAAELGVSVSLLHKWQEGAEHQVNPAERLAVLTRVTRDRRLLEWLCAEADGFFVRNVPVKVSPPADWPAASGAVLKDLGQVQMALAETLAQPESAARTAVLRRHWQALKSHLERLVRTLEQGQFRRNLVVWFLKLYPLWDAATPGGLI